MVKNYIKLLILLVAMPMLAMKQDQKAVACCSGKAEASAVQVLEAQRVKDAKVDAARQPMNPAADATRVNDDEIPWIYVPESAPKSANDKAKRGVPKARERQSARASNLTQSQIVNSKQHSKKSFELLADRKQCQTLFNDPARRSSTAFRELAFEAFEKLGFACPEREMITNDKEGSKACSGNIQLKDGEKVKEGELGRHINMNEEYWNKHPYGVQRLVIFHEAAHVLTRDHDPAFLISLCMSSALNKRFLYNQRSRKNERNADALACQKGACALCVLDCANYYFSCMPPLERKVMTAVELDRMDIASIKAKIDELESRSEKECTTHPLDEERAYTCCLYYKENKEKRCAYHAQH